MRQPTNGGGGRCAARNNGGWKHRFPMAALAPAVNLGFNLNNLGYLFVAASKTVATNPGFRTTSSGISNMPRLHNSAWLRPALAFLALAGLLALAACGGGSGAVQAPGNVQTPPTAVTVIPETQTIYPGTPASFTISCGVPPYQAFSSNSAILPVAQSVAGNQVVVVHRVGESPPPPTACEPRRRPPGSRQVAPQAAPAMPPEVATLVRSVDLSLAS